MRVKQPITQSWGADHPGRVMAVVVFAEDDVPCAMCRDRQNLRNKQHPGYSQPETKVVKINFQYLRLSGLS